VRLKLLGTGNAAGMPVYGCTCARCATVRENPEQRRGPASALLEVGENRYLIDGGLMDIADRYPAGSLDGIFLTHFHPDHVQGLFHLRWGKGDKIPIYCPPDSVGCADLFKHPGILQFHAKKKFTSFELGCLRITPLPLIHSKVTFGYLFEYQDQRIAYLTDTKGLPLKACTWLEKQPLDLLVIDTSYPPGKGNSGHNNLDESLDIHTQLRSKRTVLTHISHDFDVWLHQTGNSLPEVVIAAHDGQVIFPVSKA